MTFTSFIKIYAIDLSRLELLTLRLSGVHSSQLSYKSQKNILFGAFKRSFPQFVAFITVLFVNNVT